MLAEKLLLTEGVAIRAPFRLPEEAHLETRLRLPLGEDEERRPQGAGVTRVDYVRARGGIRTHMARRPSLFKSDSSAYSDTRALGSVSR